MLPISNVLGLGWDFKYSPVGRRGGLRQHDVRKLQVNAPKMYFKEKYFGGIAEVVLQDEEGWIQGRE